MKKIQNKICRICNSSNLYEVATLIEMPLTDEFVNGNNIGKEYLFNIEIGICCNCGIVQNINDTNMDKYYKDYQYTIAGSKFANQFMDKIAYKIKKSYYSDIDYVPKLLEIGSGSGEQLMMFKKYGFEVIGVEPSEYLANYANLKDITTIQDFFHEEMLYKINSQVDCILSSYTFDHIPYINKTFDAIKSILKPNGKLIVEVHDFNLIVERREYCLFEHEHYIYLNKDTADFLFRKNGFQIITFDLLNDNEKRANSLLIVAQINKDRNEVELKFEPKKEIEKYNLNFNIQNTINKIDEWLEKNKDKVVIAYGAGGRGIMTIAALKNYQVFKYIVDLNPKGNDIYSPKTHIPVKKTSFLLNEKADLIFVFSYGYFNEIVESLSIYGYQKEQFISLLDFI
jgi:SAM-dependent methyltransferase